MCGNSSVRKLNIGHNAMGPIGAAAVKRMLSQSTTLKHLSLSWCNLRDRAATLVAQGFGDNRSLESLDLSWNAFGSSIRQTAVGALGAGIAANDSCQHLDLSHNGFSAADCAVLAKHLASNHTVLGLHAAGCPAFVDPQGFLRPAQLTAAARNSHFAEAPPRSIIDADEILRARGHAQAGSTAAQQPRPLSRASPRRAPAVASTSLPASPVSVSSLRQLGADPTHGTCWICNGWTEHAIKFVAPQGSLPADAAIERVFACLDVDAFAPSPMEPCAGRKGEFELHRMLPPRSVLFYFVVSLSTGEQRQLASAAHLLASATAMHGRYGFAVESTASAPSSRPSSRPASDVPRGARSAVMLGVYDVTVALASSAADYSHAAVSLPGRDGARSLLPSADANVVMVQRGQWPLRCVRALPRLEPGAPPPTKRLWSLPTSVFAPRMHECDSRWFFDTPKLLKRAFLADLHYTKFSRLIKDEEDLQRTLELLGERFEFLQDVFRAYLVKGTSDLFSMTQNSFVEFVKTCQIPDDDTCGPGALATLFKATDVHVGTEAKEVKSMDHRLCRFEFLEVVVRLALQKHLACETLTSGHTRAPS
jgi:hypothetical protein